MLPCTVNLYMFSTITKCQWLETGRLFSPGTLVSSTDIAEILLSAVNCPKHKPINTKFVFYGYRNSLVKIMKICSWKKEKRPSNRHRMRNVNNSCPFLVLLVPMKFQKKCRIDISSTISLHDFYSNSRHRYLPYVVFIL